MHSTDDSDGFATRPYTWAEVQPSNVQSDGTSGGADGSDDIELTVDDNNASLNGNGETTTTDSTGGCDSDLYLPEDKYSITFEEDSFDNEGDSGDDDGDGSCDDDPDECTYADDVDTTSNGGSAEVTDTHCMGPRRRNRRGRRRTRRQRKQKRPAGANHPGAGFGGDLGSDCLAQSGERR